MDTNKFLLDLNIPIYANDIETGRTFLVDGIFFPLGKVSGKDVTIQTDDDVSEWRSINEVELIQYPPHLK